MREVRVILPKHAPYGVHRWLQDKLLDHFDGFTSFDVVGGWRSDDPDNPTIQTETGVAYDVAVPDRPESDWLLQEAVLGLFDRTDERAIYVRARDGTVTVLSRPDPVPAHSDPIEAAPAGELAEQAARASGV